MRYVGDRLPYGPPIEWILTRAVTSVLMIATLAGVSAASAPLADRLAQNLAFVDAGADVRSDPQCDCDACRGSMPEALKAPLMST